MTSQLTVAGFAETEISNYHIHYFLQLLHDMLHAILFTVTYFVSHRIYILRMSINVLFILYNRAYITPINILCVSGGLNR